MINYAETFKCDTCYGRGIIFVGDKYDYSIEPCECVSEVTL